MVISRLWKALASTKETIGSEQVESASQDDRLINANQSDQAMPPQTWQDFENRLLESDFGPRLARYMVDELQQITSRPQTQALKNLLLPWLEDVEKKFELADQGIEIILVNGVNGSGKTATCGKLGHALQEQGRSVGLVAADTFRAAAIEQLAYWAERSGCKSYSTSPGSDPGAAVYRAIEEAGKDGIDTLLIDTAGRLHNKQNLMDELAKIHRVIEKKAPQQPRYSLFVMDGASGQNAMKQLELFRDVSSINGLVVTKLDGSARGGIIVRVAEHFVIPIFFLGVGEGMLDLIPFDARVYLNALLGTAT